MQVSETFRLFEGHLELPYTPRTGLQAPQTDWYYTLSTPSPIYTPPIIAFFNSLSFYHLLFIDSYCKGTKNWENWKGVGLSQ